MRTDNISAIFGQVLREQRTSRGFSQEDLALTANVDRTFVSQMERGIRQPSITTLIKLSNALGLQPSALVAKMERLLRPPSR
jgi:transcriptional regulator with XRE-family HTH domain